MKQPHNPVATPELVAQFCSECRERIGSALDCLTDEQVYAISLLSAVMSKQFLRRNNYELARQKKSGKTEV